MATCFTGNVQQGGRERDKKERETERERERRKRNSGERKHHLQCANGGKGVEEVFTQQH